MDGSRSQMLCFENLHRRPAARRHFSPSERKASPRSESESVGRGRLAIGSRLPKFAGFRVIVIVGEESSVKRNAASSAHAIHNASPSTAPQLSRGPALHLVLVLPPPIERFVAHLTKFPACDAWHRGALVRVCPWPVMTCTHGNGWVPIRPTPASMWIPFQP